MNSLEKSSHDDQKSLHRRPTTIHAMYDSSMSGRRMLTLMGSLRVALDAERYVMGEPPRSPTAMLVGNSWLICLHRTKAQQIGLRVRRSA